MSQYQPSMGTQTPHEQCGELKSVINNLQRSIGELTGAVALIESDKNVIIGLSDIPKVLEGLNQKKPIQPSIIDRIRESVNSIEGLKTRLQIVSEAF